MTPRRRQAGFTLLEVVVAFVLLALTLVTIFQIFSTGLARAGDLDEYSRALVIAQSKLAATGVEEKLQEGESGGHSEDNRYRWSVTVKAYEEARESNAPAPQSSLLMYRVEARVDWKSTDGRERNVQLSTLALGPQDMRRETSAGFTLVELLIAVTLLAMMLSMAWSGLSFALRAWESGEANGHRTADLRLSENFLRRELSEVFPMRWKDAMTLKFAFEGDAARLRFVSVRPPGISASGLSLVGLELEQAAGTRVSNLVMRRAPPDHDARDFAPLDRAERSVLIENVQKVEFAYFGSDGDVNEPRWSDSWTVATRMPLLVRLRVTTADGAQLPEMVVRIMLGEEAGCLENTFQRVCRPRRPA